jgi:hypothetical protein
MTSAGIPNSRKERFLKCYARNLLGRVPDRAGKDATGELSQ